MKYMGSKNKIAKYIVNIIQKIIEDEKIITYIEPFCGGCNVIDKIDCKSKIASDKHKFLIAMFKNLNKIESLPEFVSKEHYSDVRDSFNKKENKYEDWYIGAIGFLASYNGRFFDGGYAKIVKTKINTIRNYYDEAKRNILEQIPYLNDITFKCCDYSEYNPKDYINCLFYCDPPYKGTKQYGTSKNFDYEMFWKWAEDMSKNNVVIVSEYQAPDSWNCIWEKPIKRTINNNKTIDGIEKLFILKKYL